MSVEPKDIVEAFLKVAELAHMPMTAEQVRHELLPAPHRRPSNLPAGLQAVYAFLVADRCLKVGKAGPKTAARFTSQHYGMNAPSTLAKSILGNRQLLASVVVVERRCEVERLDEATVGAWIERNTSRVHLFLPAPLGALPLALLETFVQCRLNPLFEGKVM